MENLETQERVLNETRVYRGDDLFREIVPRLHAEFKEGEPFFLYEDGEKVSADKLIAELKKGGYRLCISCQSEFDNKGASETVNVRRAIVRSTATDFVQTLAST